MNSFQDVVANLRFLSKILPNQKIDITILSLRSNNTYTRVYRTYRTWILQDEGSHRNASLDFINNTFQNAFQIQASFTNTEIYKNQILLTAIQDALKGIGNLKQTYEDDKMFLARLETIESIYSKQLEQLTQVDTC